MVTQGCPCGFFTDPQKECTFTPLQIQRYRSKVSGPLLDRIDIQVKVTGSAIRNSPAKDAGESSNAIRERVKSAKDSVAALRQNKNPRQRPDGHERNQTLLFC